LHSIVLDPATGVFLSFPAKGKILKWHDPLYKER